jgi:hypothetical protein
MLLACWNIEPALDGVVMGNILVMGAAFMCGPVSEANDFNYLLAMFNFFDITNMPTSCLSVLNGILPIISNSLRI